MKKNLSLVFIIGICLLGCSKPKETIISTNGALADTFNITYNGKTYNIHHLGESDVSIYTRIDTPDGTSQEWETVILVNNPHFRCAFTSRKYGYPGTAAGVYKSGNANSLGSNLLELEEHDDTKIFYTSGLDGSDTTSTVTVTEFTSHKCKGTFNVVLSYNGNHYPATGEFVYHR